MTCYCSSPNPPALPSQSPPSPVAAAAALADFDTVFDRFAGKIPGTLVGLRLLCHDHRRDAVGRESEQLFIYLMMMVDISG